MWEFVAIIISYLFGSLWYWHGYRKGLQQGYIKGYHQGEYDGHNE